MKEQSKKELAQNNAKIDSQKEMTEEELNQVAGGFGGQIASTAALNKFSLFRRNNIDTQVINISCW